MTAVENIKMESLSRSYSYLNSSDELDGRFGDVRMNSDLMNASDEIRNQWNRFAIIGEVGNQMRQCADQFYLMWPLGHRRLLIPRFSTNRRDIILKWIQQLVREIQEIDSHIFCFP